MSGVCGCDICVAVATHKPYPMPRDEAYLPLWVGAALHPQLADEFAGEYAADDASVPPWASRFVTEGARCESISSRNREFCELTGLYWIWKNISCPYKGLVHYRRLLAGGAGVFPGSQRASLAAGNREAASADELAQALDVAHVILPKARDYRIETIYSHYAHTFGGAHLDVMRDVIAETAPGYLEPFDHQMRSTRAHMFNMLVMRQDLLDAYCEWLFGLMFVFAERTLPEDCEDDFEARFPGRVAERLLDVWLSKNGIAYVEMPLLNAQPVNWLRKGGAFLAAKFAGKKYTRSF